ncbi:Hypothetical Protein FCC1311_038342 [Hondaea fermentalgiana]|uniref:Capsule synthesis protein CapA domain-containing protein n=1 Tax=Hondaea fermentalgiana TaxID=2315210 RepID=A0A2R5GH61_9STRA|nr:Hypothetical Protein FCC1311_038342 [Hondaea fermentalgiana]|eukprot:GBG27611.1 Hypothetical Protein FCC1311_038342 [Hondaea fermentalgiana]
MIIASTIRTTMARMSACCQTLFRAGPSCEALSSVCAHGLAVEGSEDSAARAAGKARRIVSTPDVPGAVLRVRARRIAPVYAPLVAAAPAVPAAAATTGPRRTHRPQTAQRSRLLAAAGEVAFGGGRLEGLADDDDLGQGLRPEADGAGGDDEVDGDEDDGNEGGDRDAERTGDEDEEEEISDDDDDDDDDGSNDDSGAEAREAASDQADDGYRGPRAETFTIAHTGDTMISQNINLHVYARGEYTYLWKSVSHLWKDHADLTISNFEGTCTSLTGAVPRRKVSNINKANFRSVYTSSNTKGGFNYPPAFARALFEDAKIDVMTLGNNHIFDRSVQGIGITKRTLENIGFITAGVTDPTTIESAQDFKDPERWYKIVRRKGWKLALISCTTFPFGQNWAPYILFCNDVLSLIKEHVRPTHPDLDAIVVLPHWGTEFVVQTTANQNKLAKAWIKAGVNLILGNHPHVVQRTESTEDSDGVRTSFTAYSLGGLVGGLGQAAKETARPRASAVLLATLAKSASGQTIVQNVVMEPICEVYEPFMITRGKFVKTIPVSSTDKCKSEERIVTQLLEPAATRMYPKPEDDAMSTSD